MTRKNKWSFKLYPQYIYLSEIDDLNRESENGWQLAQAHAVGMKFTYNPDVCYRYQLDFQKQIDDMPMYLEFFREQGWEFVGRLRNGWNYFRKAYDPSLPESAYEIHTDSSSLQDMIKRSLRVEKFFSVYWALLTAFVLYQAITARTLPAMILAVPTVLIMVLVVRGISVMSRKIKLPKPRLERYIYLGLLVILLCTSFLSGVFVGARAYFDCEMHEDNISEIVDADGVMWKSGSVEVTYRDNYLLDLDIESETMLRFSIISETGEEVYTLETDSVSLKGERIKLEKGSYTVQLSECDSGELDFFVRLH